MNKLYKVSQTINNDYDTYSDFVIACENEEIARNTHPSRFVTHQRDGKWYGTGGGTTNMGVEYETENSPYGSWVDVKDLDKVVVEEIGVAKDGIVGIICSSFHAG